MDLLTRGDLQQLFEFQGHPCVSLLMPTHRSGPDVRQDPIRLRNLLTQAEEELVETGLRRPAAKELLQPAAELEADGSFWQTRGDGLAIFLARGFFRTFRLPQPVDEQVVVDDRFHATPLVSAIQHDGRFYVLVFSLNHVRAFQADRHHIREFQIEGLPQGLSEAVGKEYEQSLQFHSQRGRSFARGGEESAMYHGQFEGRPEADILQYCRAVDEPVAKALAGQTDPLVFAGVEYLFPIYRAANRYRGLVDEPLTGSFERSAPQELHQLALKIVEPIFERAQHEAVEKYNDRLGAGAAANDLAEILPAACDGRVESLFLARGAQLWGAFDCATRQAAIHAEPSNGDEDLIDRAAVETVRRGGEIFLVDAQDIPGGGPCAAVYRYAVVQPQPTP